ncbi:rhomboid family intramembrane serine protease [Desulfothermus sp.]
MTYIPITNHNNDEKINEWSLVLTALCIDHVIQKTENGFYLKVKSEDKERAIKEILEFEKELEEDLKEQNHENTKNIKSGYSIESSIWILFFIFLFHIISKNLFPPLEQLGCANSWAIYKGEWWRLITSLTLHKNIPHVLSNIFWEGVFIYFLLKEIPPSIGWALIFLGGALGNLFNYFFHPLSHISLGFSTCVFATIGISIGIRGIQNPKDIGVYAMSGLGLFAMLGIGAQGVDVGSHFFGLITGFIIGAVFQLLNLNIAKIKAGYLFFALFLIIAISWTLAIFWGKNYV